MSCAEDMILVMLCVPYTACTILLALSARFGHLRRQLRAFAAMNSTVLNKIGVSKQVGMAFLVSANIICGSCCVSYVRS